MSSHPNGNGRVSLPKGPILCDNWQEIVAEEYERTLSPTAACRKVGISRQTYYRYLQNDPAFAEMIENAYNAAKEKLQASAYERAVNGTESVREFYDNKGNITSVAKTTQHETQLTIRMLEAHIPETYRITQRNELTGLNGAPIVIDVTEQKRVAVTMMAQELLNNGWELKVALAHMIQLGIPAEDVKLLRGEDLVIKPTNGNKE